MSEFLLDRSRVQTYLQCPRLYFWKYEYALKGLSSNRRPVPLAIGGSVHKALEMLLRGSSEDEAVRGGVAEYLIQRDQGLSLEPQEDVLFVYKEQECLIEALVRVWARRRWPSFQEEYELLEIEQEYDLPLVTGVTFMSRADGLLRKRSDGRIYVLSFKTCNRYDHRLSSDGGHDVQGLSEVAAIERLLNEEIAGVQMEYLVKGVRSAYQDRISQNSFLVHPWFNAAKDEFAWQYKWRDATGGHALGKGWAKVDIWDFMSIGDWLARLESGKVQEGLGDALASVCISPLPYFRRKEETEDWLEQVAAIGTTLRQSREETGGVPDRHKLNVLYPQNRRACDWPTACPMQMICFGPCGSEPLEGGLYVQREPHHETELEQFEDLES